MSRVVVHIDRLVLQGFRAHDRHQIAAGLQQELGRVFAGREAVSRLRATGDMSGLKVGDVRITQRSTPKRIGEAVGQRIGKEARK